MTFTLSSGGLGRIVLLFTEVCDWAQIDDAATAIMMRKTRQHFFTGATPIPCNHNTSVRLGLRSLAMGVEPDFGLLARGGDLRLGHLGGQPF